MNDRLSCYSIVGFTVAVAAVLSSCLGHTIEAGRLEGLSRERVRAGDLAGAIDLLERAVALRERSNDRQSLVLARSLAALADLHHEQDNHDAALQASERGLAALAGVRQDGLYEMAFRKRHEAIRGADGMRGRTREPPPPREHIWFDAVRLENRLDDALSVQGRLLASIARVLRARAEYDQAFAVLELAFTYKQLAEKGQSANKAAIVHLMALTRRDQGDRSALQGQSRLAFRRYAQALELWQRFSGDRYERDIIQTLIAMARVHFREGQLRLSHHLLQRALSRVAVELSDHDDPVALAEILRAELFHSEKLYAEAERSYTRALSVYQQTLGDFHPNIVRTLTQLAWVHHEQFEGDRALEFAQAAEVLRERQVTRLLGTGSEREKRQFLAILGEDLNVVLSLALQQPRPDAAHLALTTVLRYKGRLLDVQSSSLATLRRRLGDGDALAMLSEYATVRSRYATRLLRGPEGRTRAWHKRQLDHLERRIRELEAIIGERYAAFTANRVRVTLPMVRSTLPTSSALVEWIRYAPVRGADDGADSQTPPSPRYAACVLHRTGEPVCIDQGEAAMIDAIVLDLHEALTSKLEDSGTPARKLHAAVISPLRSHLGGVTELILSPDSLLHRIPFAVLIDDDGQYLLEKYRLSYVTSGRDLPKSVSPTVTRAPALILAAPDYGQASQRFGPLAGVEREGRIVQQLLPGARLLTGAEATEFAIHNVRGPQILHIATHGYYGGTGCDEALPAQTSPLVKVGVALAGANRCQGTSDPSNDGLLSAYEIVALDLRDTELAVLSACETGLGEPVSGSRHSMLVGQGLYSVRRALVLAGARTQMVSLWKVDDRATQEFMIGYYRRLVQGADRTAALREVQRNMLERGLHPYYWASFLLSGKSGPIDVMAGEAAVRALPERVGDAPGCACTLSRGASDQAAFGGGSWAFIALVVLCTARRRQQQR